MASPEPSNSSLTSSQILQRSAVRWGAILFSLAAILIVWPLWQPLVLASWFAILSRPLMHRVGRMIGGRDRAAAVLTILMLLLVLVIVGFFAMSVITAATELSQNLVKSKGGKDALAALVSNGGAKGQFAMTDIIPLTKTYGERVLLLATSIAGVTANVLLGIFVFFLSAYAFLANGPSMSLWIQEHLPISRQNYRRYESAFEEIGRGLIVGIGLTALIQGLAGTVAYLALGIPRAVFLGVLTAIASLIPSVGTMLVWAPVAAGLALTGDWTRAVIMALIGILVIGMVDNLLRPVFSRHGNVQLPTFVFVVAMFGGLATIGPWGLLLGPILVRLAVEAVSIERDARSGKPASTILPPNAGPPV